MSSSPAAVPDGEPDPKPDQDPTLPPAPVPVTLRQAPRFGRFIAVGAFVGVLLGVVAVALRPQGAAADYSLATLVGYLGAVGALLGVFVGALLAVLFDRRS